MISPQKKARELVETYKGVLKHGQRHWGQTHFAKQCALMSVEEIIKELDGLWADIAGSINRSCQDTVNHRAYWQQVKLEIDKI